MTSTNGPLRVGIGGPVGSGKTALAIQEGLRALKRGIVDRIIVSRPNVHAKGEGEGLGFLPGSEMDKLRPLAGPVLDHIDEFTAVGTAEKLLKSGQLKLCSFEYMRGTTFKRAWVVADEVQNASLMQLKLLTGRIGEGSKMCILGDPEQCDRSRANWEHSSLRVLCDEIESGKHSDAWACVRFGAHSTPAPASPRAQVVLCSCRPAFPCRVPQTATAIRLPRSRSM